MKYSFGSALTVALIGLLQLTICLLAEPSRAQTRKATATEIAAIRDCATRNKDNLDEGDDKIQGSMAITMHAACTSRESARRAMLLQFFSRL